MGDVPTLELVPQRLLTSHFALADLPGQPVPLPIEVEAVGALRVGIERECIERNEFPAQFADPSSQRRLGPDALEQEPPLSK